MRVALKAISRESVPEQFAEGGSSEVDADLPGPADSRAGLIWVPAIGSLSPRYLRQHGVLPVALPDGAIALALRGPVDEAVIDLVCATLGVEAETMGRLTITPEDLAAHLPDENDEDQAADDAEPIPAGSGGDEDIESLRDLASNAPIVRLLNDIFEAASRAKATDIHFEPARGAIKVRIRVDGLLRTLRSLPAETARPLVSRVKILAGLDIAERRLPQDGRMRHSVENADYDVRVATMPTAHGETAILRLLDQSRRLVSLDALGLSGERSSAFAAHLEAPHGLIIVTGPTGSGKTTTLASALAEIDRGTRKVLTIEDPIEYEIEGVAQSQLRPQIGLTYATALRSFLRQDPDVIMVGEMRDGETAKIGIQASLTGHLVLTTLHTNTAAAAIPRLTDLGAEPYLVAACLRCIVGQRLVRMLCPHCRRVETLTEEQLADDGRPLLLGLRAGESVAVPTGCPRCSGSGYAGRLGIFEVLDATTAIRELIISGASEQIIEGAAQREGMSTMIEDGASKVRAGLTSVDEVIRVAAVR